MLWLMLRCRATAGWDWGLDLLVAGIIAELDIATLSHILAHSLVLDAAWRSHRLLLLLLEGLLKGHRTGPNGTGQIAAAMLHLSGPLVAMHDIVQ